MRIAHVLTLLSIDGAYGGPASVALNQVQELARRGHEVTLFAGWDGLVAPPSHDDLLVRLVRVHSVIPAAGFSGLVAPGIIHALIRNPDQFDVVHIHLARDLITLPAASAALRQRSFVVQPHGMLRPDLRIRSRLLDAIGTRRILRAADAVLALTQQEKAGLQTVARRQLAIEEMPNGIDLRRNAEQRGRRILFCARLHPRKRVGAFAEMAVELTKRGIDDLEFAVIGPDEGDLSKLAGILNARSASALVTYEGPVDSESARQAIAEAFVYVLPSFDEPFPMSVLEALAAGTPAVITDKCMIADDLRGRGAALVTDGSVQQLADAVEFLASNPLAWKRQSEAGLAAIADTYSIATVVDRLETVYERVSSK